MFDFSQFFVVWAPKDRIFVFAFSDLKWIVWFVVRAVKTGNLYCEIEV